MKHISTAVLSVVLIGFISGESWAYKRSLTELGDPIDWNRRCIGFHIFEEGSEDIEFATLVDTIQKSFLTWQAVSCSSQEFVYAGVTADSLVGYRQGGPNINTVIFQEDAANWPHPRDVVALTTVTFCREPGGACDYVGEILDADIEFNGAYLRFSTRDPAPLTRFDVENSLTHEIGHLLGFDHSTDPEATMYASAPPGETDKRDLSEDDTQALCDVYPNIDPLPECEPIDTNDDPGYEQPLSNDGVGCDGCSAHSALDANLWWLFAVFLAFRGRRRGTHRCSSP